jgi:KDO2-lipid IV(A) lauroyltransferase
VNTLLAWVVMGFIRLLQLLPLDAVARLGRAGGAVAFVVDRRHRRVALENLERVFGKELDAAQRFAIARENFRRLGENYACTVKTPFMSREAVEARLEWSGVDDALRSESRNIVGVVGHFGNFELYARTADQLPGRRFATTYRALRQPALDRILLDLRERSRVEFFERRSGANALRRALNEGNMLVALLSDQHGGDGGLWLPFLGHPASCNPAAATLALRYDASLRSAICFRTGLARWRIEIGPEIPLRDAAGQLREVEAVQRDVNARLEEGIRRDPANWFWVHRRWKPPSARQRAQAVAGASNSPI